MRCILRYGAISTTIGRPCNRRMFAPDITLRAANPRIATAKKISHHAKIYRDAGVLDSGCPPPHLAGGDFGNVRATIFFTCFNDNSFYLSFPPTIPNSSTTHQSALSSPHPSKSHPATVAQIPPSPTSASHQSPSSTRNPESATHDPAYPPAPD
jgi:hypothetical protein